MRFFAFMFYSDCNFLFTALEPEDFTHFFAIYCKKVDHDAYKDNNELMWNNLVKYPSCVFQ